MAEENLKKAAVKTDKQVHVVNVRKSITQYKQSSRHGRA